MRYHIILIFSYMCLSKWVIRTNLDRSIPKYLMYYLKIYKANVMDIGHIKNLKKKIQKR